MPRDIHVFIEKQINDNWETVLPIKEYSGYSKDCPTNNKINDSMYLPKIYPEELFGDYDLIVWSLLGIEGKYDYKKLKGLPSNLSREISNYHKSFGLEAFQEHWISCLEFIDNASESESALLNSNVKKLKNKILELGNPNEMRLIMWCSQ